ncbi:restriction endonuclease subunit S [Marinomonas gallaica]|uniref:restriction endonuclease subunit S n=1 Tax=Marinomonas gallaica TaxID=1806667 RepID=UPI003CE5343D
MAEQHKLQQLITEHIDLWTGAVKDKSSAGRGGSSKRELYGIKKLRELILELAVRGKLVAQDPNDEPASVLLERIAAEKVELVKQGKIKKPKKLPEISQEEKPFELPKGWEWTRLGDLSSEIHYGYTASALPNSDGIRLLRITDIQDDKVNWSTVPACEITLEKAEGYLLENNDILLARTGGTIGKSYLVENINVNAVFASYLIRVRKIESMYASFIKVYLGSKLYWKQLYANSAGTGQPNVNATALKSLLVPVASIEEQHRIVAKVDELMALCDQLEQQTESSLDAHQTLVQILLDTLLQSADAEEPEQNWQRLSAHFDLLFTTEQSIDQLKQTILQLAVMGKLVPQDPNDEPASELLKRIVAEKEELVKQKKIKKQKPLPPISDDEKPFQLPKGWEWCRFDCTSLTSGAGWSPQCLATPREGENWGVLKVSAVTWDVFNPLENKALPDHLEARDEHEVKSGDFLISRANTADLVAKAVVVPENVPEKLMMSDKIIRFKFHSEVVGHFLNLVNNSYFSRAYYQRVAGGTSSSMKNVSREQIRSLVVPLPPKEEQKRVITIVDQLMSLCDQLKAKLADSKTTQLNLTDALVAQAV